MNNPTKEQVREWQKQRQFEHTPPPSRDEIRRQLGWDMIPENNENKNNPCNPKTDRL